MGIYVCLLAAAELYYLTEYIDHCMHEYLTHPSEREELKLHADSTGDSSKIPKTWKGPVFMTRLHLLKVRAVKQTYFWTYGLLFEETEAGRKFRIAHESQVQLMESKDRLKKSHLSKTGHKDVTATKKFSSSGGAPEPPRAPLRAPDNLGSI